MSYSRDGDFWNKPRGACADLYKRTGELVDHTRADIRPVLESYGYKHDRSQGYRATMDKWNAKLKRRIRRTFRKIGRIEKYFI